MSRGKETVLKCMNFITKVFHQKYTLTECNRLTPNLMRLSNGSWTPFGKKSETACFESVSISEETRQETRPREVNGSKENGLCTGEIALTILFPNLLRTLVRFLMRIIFINRPEQLGTKTRFGQPIIPFSEYNQNLAEVWELWRYKSQLEKDVNVERKNRQSDCVEVLKKLRKNIEL